MMRLARRQATPPRAKSSGTTRAEATAARLPGRSNQALLKASIRTTTPSRPSRSVQRKCSCESSGAGPCADGGCLQRAGEAPAPAAPPVVGEPLRAPGRPLELGVRGFMETRFGRDFRGVRVHDDDTAARGARAVDALAYTVGRHVVFGRGQYAPHTPAGQWLLAHELAHTIQQGDGAAEVAALRVEGPDTAAEREADTLADSIARGPILDATGMPARRGPAVQRRFSGLVIQRAVSTFCQPPGFWLPIPQAAAFGFIAEKFIEADYMSKMGVAPPATAYFDSALAGPIDPAMVRFIILHNPGLATWKQVFLAITPVRRPDILADNGTLQEYEEIKTDSIFGITEGFAKLLEIRAWTGALSLPYVRGSAYSPTARIPLFSSTLPTGIPFNLSLAVRRESNGLIVYKLCIETDFLKLTLAALIAALIAAIIILIPKPLPVPVPAVVESEPSDSDRSAEGSAVAEAGTDSETGASGATGETVGSSGGSEETA
jgi:hypothetical protein